MADNFLETKPPITKKDFDNLIDEVKKCGYKKFDPEVLTKLLLLCYQCALKKSELINLKIGDVFKNDFITDAIEIGESRLELGSTTKRILMNYSHHLRDNGYKTQPQSPLFPTVNKNFYKKKTLQNHLKEVSAGKIGLNKIRKLAICCYYDNLTKTNAAPQECLKKTSAFARLRERSTAQLLTDQIQPAGKQFNVTAYYLEKIEKAKSKYDKNGQTTKPLEEISEELDKETRLNTKDINFFRKQIENIKKSAPEPHFKSDDESEKSHESIIDMVTNFGKEQN